MISKRHLYKTFVFAVVGSWALMGFARQENSPTRHSSKSTPAPAPLSTPIAALPSNPSVSQPSSAAQLKFNEAYGKLPLYFEPNPSTGSGQAPPQVKFISRGKGYTLFLTAQ